jgi:hypothetical protein
MKAIELAEATHSLADAVLAALVEPITVTHAGRPLVVISSAIGCDAESVALSVNKEFLAIIEQSRELYRRNGGIPAAEMRRWVEALEESEGDEAIDLSRSPRLREILDAAREDYKRRGGVPASEVKRGLLGESTGNN